jgi:hypothetical protein
MKLLRLSLGCTLLLLAAFPSFALSCKTCDDFVINQCNLTPGSGTRCLFHIDYCETVSSSFCVNLADNRSPSPILADWSVASIEISRPDGTKVVTAPVALAKARTHPTAPRQ